MILNQIKQDSIRAYPTITIEQREIKTYAELDKFIADLNEKRKVMRDGFISQIRAGNTEPDSINYNL